MKFDFVIGNPPYQQEAKGANSSDTPIYHYFYNEAFKIGNKVELISPARFLFKAGATPKEWNEKMLDDVHLKVEEYYPKSVDVFANTEIKGGVVITYRDNTKSFGAIKFYSPYVELNSIMKKTNNGDSLSSIIANRGSYKYSSKAYLEEPEEMKKTADKRIAPSCFERMPKLFTDNKPDSGEYIQILGYQNGKRTYKWFRSDYLAPVDSLHKYKVLISKANGNGTFGETLSPPLIGKPGIGFTETFISIGIVDTENEAKAILNYIKTKFARALLGSLKVTQNMSSETWQYVPLQDFSSKSDIDWSCSIHEIDRQLYKKYGLTDEEKEFIETHVKEML